MIPLTLISTVVSMALIGFNVQPVWIQLIAFAVSAALFLTTLGREMPRPEKVQRWLQRKSFLFIALFLLAITNLIAKKYDHVFDLSQGKIYALRPQTIEWISKLQEPTEILVFLRRDDKTVAYAEWLQDQIDRASRSVKVSIKNINQEVSLTQKYDVKQTGEVVLVSGERWVKIPSFQEKDLIQGVSRLVSRTSSSMCFLTGHGESDVEDETPEGLSRLKDFLIGTGYRVLSVSFTTHTQEEILQKCGLLALVNPKTNFLPEELKAFNDLFSSPLPMIVSLETTFSSNMKEALAKTGLTISSDPLIDTDNLKRRKPLTDILLTRLNTHPVFEGFGSGLYLPQSRALFQQATPSPFHWESLITTPVGSENIQLLEDKKNRGPFTVANIGGFSKQSQDKVIFGAGRSWINASIGYGENQKLFFNLSKTLLKEPLVNFSQSFEESEKRLILSSQELFWIKNLCFYILPAFFTSLCLLVWWRRWKIS